MKSSKLEHYLQLNVATLVVLGTLLLGMGQRSFLYPIIALIAATVSYWMVDRARLFWLSPTWTRIFSILIVFWLMLQMIRNVEQSQLLNVANSLLLLQMILLFHRKSHRIYWELLALSLLQVAVAAALNLGFLFGIMLLVYVLVALIGLAMFFVLREVQFVAASDWNQPATAVTSGPSRSTPWAAFRWHATSDSTDFIFQPNFLKRLSWLAFVSILGTVLLFFALPRYSDQVWNNPRSRQAATVGFTEEVELDDMQNILENPEQVMRVEFTRLDRNAYTVKSELYFRGTVLSEYRKYKDAWRHQPFAESKLNFNNVRPPDLSNVVVQKTTLQPSQHPVIFNVAPSYKISDRRHLDFDLGTHLLELSLARERKSEKEPIRYEIATTAFRDGIQTPWLPCIDEELDLSTNERGYVSWKTERLLSPWSEKGAEDLSQVRDIAQQILADAGLESGSQLEKARALESHFLESPDYEYSLKPSKDRNRRVKPIVDFLTNHRTGHCEYFASALALMLRSQGIPARLIVGYKGGDYNGVGGFFVVRQLHCHAWVEVYIPPQEIPPGVLLSSEDRGKGAWLRLDPTPAESRIYEGEATNAILTTLHEFFDYCQVLWDDYVLGLNSDRQRQSIYQPIITTGHQVVYFLFGRDIWIQRVQWSRRQAHAIITGRWITWQSIILLAILAPLLYAVREPIQAFLARMYDRMARLAWKRMELRPTEHVFHRMERLLTKHGHRRLQEQTPLEYANAVASAWANEPGLMQVADIPKKIVQAFYRVRFGYHSLSSGESKTLDEMVSELDKQLRAN